MLVTEVNIRVRYGETDQMGYVYYGNYALYYEVGRVEALRSLGYTYKGMEQSGTMMPIAAMNSKYIRLASYDDLLTVKNFVKQMPKATMVFDYEIYNQHQTLIHQAQTTLVFIDVKTQRPVRCPEFLHQALEPFFSNS